MVRSSHRVSTKPMRPTKTTGYTRYVETIWHMKTRSTPSTAPPECAKPDQATSTMVARRKDKCKMRNLRWRRFWVCRKLRTETFVNWSNRLGVRCERKPLSRRNTSWALSPIWTPSTTDIQISSWTGGIVSQGSAGVNDLLERTTNLWHEEMTASQVGPA